MLDFYFQHSMLAVQLLLLAYFTCLILFGIYKFTYLIIDIVSNLKTWYRPVTSTDTKKPSPTYIWKILAVLSILQDQASGLRVTWLIQGLGRPAQTTRPRTCQFTWSPSRRDGVWKDRGGGWTINPLFYFSVYHLDHQSCGHSRAGHATLVWNSH